jgi:hypothetical protein
MPAYPTVAAAAYVSASSMKLDGTAEIAGRVRRAASVEPEPSFVV